VLGISPHGYFTKCSTFSGISQPSNAVNLQQTCPERTLQEKAAKQPTAALTQYFARAEPWSLLIFVTNP